MRRSNLTPVQPGDLREVYVQLLAVAHLLEHQIPDETFRHDPRQISQGLGRLLETLADELDDIAGNWERWDLARRRAMTTGKYGGVRFDG